MTKKIVNLSVDEISAVDKPANKRKFLLIKKEDEETTEKRTLEDVLDNEEAQQELWQSVQAFQISVRDTLNDEDLGEEEKAAEIQESISQWSEKLNEIAPDLAKRVDKQAVVESIKKEVPAESQQGGEDMTREELIEKIEDEEIRNQISQEFEELEKAQDSDSDDEMDIEKFDLPEPVQKRIEEMEESLKATEEIAKKEREKRLNAELTKRAEEYSEVADQDEVFDVFKGLYDVDEELLEKVESILDAAKARMKKADLFNEVGDSGEDITDAEQTLEKRVKETLEKDSSLTRAQAMREVLKEDPQLYEEYRNQ